MGSWIVDFWSPGSGRSMPEAKARVWGRRLHYIKAEGWALASSGLPSVDMSIRLAQPSDD